MHKKVCVGCCDTFVGNNEKELKKLLKVHLDIQNPFFNKCKYCGKSSIILERHVELHHNHKCVKCEKTFPSKKELDDHFIENHLDKDYSNKLIKHDIPLKKPMNIFQCKSCDETFTTKWSRLKHEKNVHNKEMKC